MIPLSEITGGRRWNIGDGGGRHLINVKTLRVNLDQSDQMKKDQHDAGYYVGKAREYRDKAHATVDPRVKSALEAVAREFIRKARAVEPTVSRQAFQ